MTDEGLEILIAELQGISAQEKVGFVRRLLDWFALEARLIGRDDRRQEDQLVRLQGSVEVLVRMLDQLRDYGLGEHVGRPDRVFIEMLLEYGQAYRLEEEIRSSLTAGSSALQRRGLVN